MKSLENRRSPVHQPSNTQNEEQKSLPIRLPPKAYRLDAPEDGTSECDLPKELLIRRQMRSVLDYLFNFEGQYIDDEKLQQLKIACTDFDLDTGGVGPSETRYISPYSRDKIEEALKITKPWETYDEIDLASYQRPESSEFKSSRRVEASFNLALVESYLLTSIDSDDGILSTCTNWAPVDAPLSRHLHRFANGKYDWNLVDTFRPFLGTENDSPDFEKPHATGLVDDDAAQCEDTLLNGELTSALYMAFSIALTENYASHRFYPVTIVSFAGRTMRFVQCILDSRTGHIEIRKSPILDFNQGFLAKENETKFLTVLSWLMGQPTGNTKDEHLSIKDRSV